MKTKNDLVNDDAAGSKSTKPKIKPQITKGKAKQSKERSNYGKVSKPSRLAAKFNAKTTQKPSPQEISGDSSKPADETSAYVTKDDLEKLLESLTGKNTEDDGPVARTGEAQPHSMPGNFLVLRIYCL